MDTIIDLCFLCTKDYNCAPVNEKIVFQVEYLLPEITIFKLGVPLRICSVCDGALCAFSKFKQSSVESSRRLEASIKGAQSRSLHTSSPPVMDNNELSGIKSEKMMEIFIKKEPLEHPLDTNNSNSPLEKISAEPQNQLHKDRVSQNMQLHTDINTGNIEEIFIKEEPMEETLQDTEFCNKLKKECVNNSINDDIDSQPEYNTEDESATFNTCEEVWERNSYSKKQTVDVKKNNCRLKVLPCAVCKKYKKEFNKHINLHCGIKNFSCLICKKRFHNKQNLKQHMKLHTEQQEKKDFRCEICNKSFKLKDYLNKHLKYHSALKKFQCESCGKSFKRKDYLIDHRKIHFGVKDFQCEICKKSFTQKYNLIAHKKYHTGVKDFQCDICEKSFTMKCTLVRHMKIHTGVKDFHCEVCEKSFTRKAYLMEHMKNHTGVQDFRCEICDKSFTWKANLIRHLKIHS